MSKGNSVELSGRGEFGNALTDFIRKEVRRIIRQVVEAELSEFMGQFSKNLLDHEKS